MNGTPLLLGSRAPRPAVPEARLGIEQEFSVLRGGETVDFSGLIHSLGFDGAKLDPGDTNAYRFPAGHAITADGLEAEFASPPLGLRPGFDGEIAAWAAFGRRAIAGRLPAGLELRGASTHVNVSAEGDIDGLCRALAATFAPALMMLWGPASGLGMFIRPRPGRVEFCGDFIDGERLRAVAVFAASAVEAAARWRGRGSLADLAVEATVQSAVGRYGYELRRTAFGADDLYARGRLATLVRAGNVPVSAERHLADCWRVLAPAARKLASSATYALLADTVAGSRPLGIEAPGDDAPQTGLPEPRTWVNASRLARTRHNGFVLETVIDTWDHAVLRIRGQEAEAYAGLPRGSVPAFFAELDQGALDDQLARFLEHGDALAELCAGEQLAAPALFRKLGNISALTPAEPPPWDSLPEPGPIPAPAGGRAAVAAGRSVFRVVQANAREAKRRSASTPIPAIAKLTPPAQSPTARRRSPVLVIALAAIAALAATGGAFALFAGGSEAPEPAAAIVPTPVSPTAVPSPTATLRPGETPPTSTPIPTATASSAATALATALPPGTANPPTATSTAVATPTDTPTAVPPTPTNTPVPNQPPTVQSVSISTVPPVTTWVIAASDPEGDALSYAWSITGEACGQPPSPGSLGNTGQASWSHSNGPPDSCLHAGTDHPTAVVTVIVRENGVPRLRCTIVSTVSRTESPPTCVPL